MAPHMLLTTELQRWHAVTLLCQQSKNVYVMLLSFTDSVTFIAENAKYFGHIRVWIVRTEPLDVIGVHYCGKAAAAAATAD